MTQRSLRSKRDTNKHGDSETYLLFFQMPKL